MDTYRAFQTTRVSANAGAWTALSIPPGSVDATISLEDSTATFRVTSNNTFGLTQGVYVGATGSYTFPGTCAETVVVYVNPSANTTAVLQVQT